MSILIIDDSEVNSLVLATQLKSFGYKVDVANRGREGLEKLYRQPFDLILLDLMMPEMSGFDVLEELKGQPRFKDLPVLIISALTDLESVIKSINLGATDYISKPITNTILRARVDAAMQKKRRTDQEKIYLKQLEIERLRSEQLLQNILPYAVAERLKMGEETIADSFENVTVLFADIVNFTQLAHGMPPIELVTLLNDIFSRFDQLAEELGVEKVKTIGDGYMAVGGAPIHSPNHARSIAQLALAIQQAIGNFTSPNGTRFSMRIGINSGPVIAGVIGRYKFSYDFWGDTVNIAKRLEEQGLEGQIHVTEETYALLKDNYQFAAREPMWIKGRGQMQTYFLTGTKGDG
ncbi:MAG: adenylate/guanylate cyclase domain-containing protein [Ardenticatenaceae bacterium]|nr:adenylate/guanylate cyclase domain-containing protein [Ardenticatenaceae bacterium]